MKYNIRLTIDTGYSLLHVVYCSPEINEYVHAVMTRALSAGANLPMRLNCGAGRGEPMHMDGMIAAEAAKYFEQARTYMSLLKDKYEFTSIAQPGAETYCVDRAQDVLYGLELHCKMHVKTKIMVI